MWIAPAQTQYFLTDQVDSVKVVTNDAGMVVTSHEYLPFGEDWITEGDTKNAPKYNSQELDKESGYYFYNARHYDPEIGRFVTPDTVIDGELSTQGWNRFAYVHNNPIRYKDPTGHKLDECEIKPVKNDGILSSVTNKMKEWSQDSSSLKSGAADLFFKAKGLVTGGNLNNKKLESSDPALRAEERGNRIGKIAEFVATAGVNGAKKQIIDFAFGAFQGLATYESTTPKEKRTSGGALTSALIGGGSSYVANLIGGSSIMKESTPIAKAGINAIVSSTGNALGQVRSGKNINEISVPSVAWAGITSGSASYLGNKTNLKEPFDSLTGKASMVIPRISGAFVISKIENEGKK